MADATRRRVSLAIDVPLANADDDCTAVEEQTPSSSVARERKTASGWKFWAKARALWFIQLKPQVWKQLQKSPSLDGGEGDESAAGSADKADSPTSLLSSARGSPSQRFALRSSPLSPMHRQYLGKLKTGIRNAGAFGGAGGLGALLLSSRVKSAAASASHAFASNKIVTHHEEGEEAAVAFWKQGDAALHTEGALQARFALRRERSVVAELQFFWEACCRSIQSGGDTSACILQYEGYATLLRRVYIVLLEEWDAEDCEEAIKEDWKNDTRGGEGEGGSVRTIRRGRDYPFHVATFQAAHRLPKLPASRPLTTIVSIPSLRLPISLTFSNSSNALSPRSLSLTPLALPPHALSLAITPMLSPSTLSSTQASRANSSWTPSSSSQARVQPINPLVAPLVPPLVGQSDTPGSVRIPCHFTSLCAFDLCLAPHSHPISKAALHPTPTPTAPGATLVPDRHVVQDDTGGRVRDLPPRLAPARVLHGRRVWRPMGGGAMP